MRKCASVCVGQRERSPIAEKRLTGGCPGMQSVATWTARPPFARPQRRS
ncbi:hypothetical protein [Acinetobacter baumannii]